METSNLTIIMLTVNRVPHNWAQFHKAKLLEAANGQPIITVSREPLDWGLNLIQTEYSFQNIFVQMLRAAKTATTEYVAIADDDTLYTKEHFAFRPNERGFWYNMTRWHLFTWGDPFYFYKPLPGNGLVIANREDMITALENRFAVASELPGTYVMNLARSVKRATVIYTSGRRFIHSNQLCRFIMKNRLTKRIVITRRKHGLCGH